ncbi:hypothetical protein [Streptomyces sp. S465]|uniref:hypothetical protein n=1 Tax=Streptomyces sp. S465 TaxID=2979468 RepID=UPI0022A87474|nr:hypothetical protein [Streptomyces sp. S465]WAP58656.1 hypothetical protein N6H00_28900 [Streptomyces sp. S465]
MGDKKTADKVDVRDVSSMERKTEEMSSRILDIIDLKKAKVTEPGPGTLPCSGYPEGAGVQRMHHPWSVYDVPFDDLSHGFDRLRAELPKHDWEIVKDGPDGSPAKTPQIVANFTRDHFSADIRLLDQRKHPDATSLIEVTVVSDCFRSKSNETGEPG